MHLDYTTPIELNIEREFCIVTLDKGPEVELSCAAIEKQGDTSQQLRHGVIHLSNHRSIELLKQLNLRILIKQLCFLCFSC